MEIASGVALVTGGSSGLGLATALALHERGARVLIVDRPGTDGAAVAARLGERVGFAPADVSDEAEVERAVDMASALGPLRFVVNCAGIVSGQRLVGRTGPAPLDGIRRVLEVNVLGTINVMRLAIAAMQSTEPVGEERGVIVNTASVAAFDGQIGQVAYAASKAAVAGVTLPAARELADARIRVMAIAPGTFETPMLASLDTQVRDSLAEQVPHPRRLGHPEEFAALVAAIIENPMLNGEVIRLDGAIRMAPR